MTGKHLAIAPGGRADTDPIHMAATEWMLRLHDPNVAPEDIIAWQSWLREDPAHTKAFQRMEEVDELLRALPEPHLAAPGQVARDSYDTSVPIRLWMLRKARLIPGWALAASVTIIVVSFAFLWATSTTWSASRGTMVLATPIGTNRSVRLADGSTVTLGGDSKVAVSFHPHERDINLLHGEAFFMVAKNPSRPFKVSAGRAIVVAVGTQFDVRLDPNQVMVDVIEGRVVVLPHSTIVPIAVLRAFRPRLLPVFVGAGEETTVNGMEVERPLPIFDPDEATSWKSGRLAFRMQPLGEVLQQINRYSNKPIVIGDPDIAALKVTGTVVGGNVSGWVDSLHSALGIVAEDESDRIVLRRAQ